MKRTRKVNPENRIKFATEKKYNYNDLNYRVGTTNRYDCKAAYISLEMWMNSHNGLEASIEAIRRRFVKKLGSYTNIYIEGLKTHLIDYVAPIEKMAVVKNKYTFVSIEITLMAKRRFVYDKDFIYACQNLAGSIFDELNGMDEHFVIRNHKK
jgi:hypothetical protein